MQFSPIIALVMYIACSVVAIVTLILLVQVMKVKLLPPTKTELPGFNPLVPTNISQVLLLANPSKVKVQLNWFSLL